MNDEDKEDLLIQVTESEESSGESEAYLEGGTVIPFVQQNENSVYEEVKCCNKSRIEFFCSGTLLVIASTLLLLLLPSYSDAVNVVSDVYTLILFSSVVSSAILLVLILINTRTNLSKLSTLTSLKPPFHFSFLLEAGVAHGIGGLLVISASDFKKVLCHLQDPTKATTLIFALMFYFLFSKKLMGVQRIFCTTTIIVGLFVCLDYGLCDEFRCRGWEREFSEDDAGHWKLPVHFLAGLVYIVGLATWTFHLFLIERGLGSLQLAQNRNTIPNPDATKHEQINASVQMIAPTKTSLKPSALILASWLHGVSATIVVLFFWIDILPYVGKASSWVQLANLTHRGLMCHIGLTPSLNEETIDCGLLPLLGWLFAVFLAVFSVSAINVLIFSQSAVLTVALMTCALPVGNIFWSFFRLPPASAGALEWWPSLTAELICTIVGFPIVAAGIYFLIRSQLTEGPQLQPCCTLRYHQRSSSTT